MGTLVAGLVALPWIGISWTLWAAALANIGVGLVALMLSRLADAEAIPKDPAGSVSGTGRPWVLLVIGASGVATLVNEVAWTRALTLIIGPTTYAFTIMLSAIIIGLAFGGFLGTQWLKRRPAGSTSLAWAELLIAASGLVIVWILGHLPLTIGQLARRYVDSFGLLQLVEFSLILGLLLVPTTFLGIAFPIAARLWIGEDPRVGTQLGRFYAINTAGGIVGAILTGFLLIPRIGTQNSLLAAAGLTVLAAIVIPVPGLKQRVGVWAAALLLVLVGSRLPVWDAELMTSGAYKYAPYYPTDLELDALLRAGDLLYYKEGAAATVTVRKTRGSTTLAIDGKIDATDAGDMLTQKMLGHLPMLLRTNPEHVAVIGLGSGVTAAAVLQYPIRTLDVIEVSPEVVEASNYFKDVNRDALRDPRVNLIVDDGRNRLRYSSKFYDVTISEPSNPWMAGMASLFTRQFFEDVHDRLTPSGIHCQWIHSYNMSLQDLRTIIRTFREVFEHASLWTLNENDFLLIGSRGPLVIRASEMESNFEKGRQDLATVRVQDLYSVLTTLELQDEDLDTFAGNADIHSDDHPVLEFRAPRYIYQNTTGPNARALRETPRQHARPEFAQLTLSTAVSENHRHRAEMLLASESYSEAAREFQLALAKNVNDERSWQGFLKSVQPDNRVELQRFVEFMLNLQRRPVVELAGARFFSETGQNERALEILGGMLQSQPELIAALELTADIHAEQGSPELPSVVDKLLKTDPGNAKGLFHLATIRFYQDRLDECIQLVRQSIEKGPGNQRARNLLAIAYGQTFQHDKAEQEFQMSLRAEPNDWITLNNFGLYLLERQAIDKARDLFAQSLEINPNNPQALAGLGETFRQSGRADLAAAWYQRALKLDPNHPVARQYAQ